MGNEGPAWEAVAAVGQIIAAAAAVIGLVFVGLQVRAAKRATDLRNLQGFVNSTIERENAFLNAEGNHKKEQAFVELLNFLEINAAAVNGNLLPSVSRKIVRDSLINSVAAIQLEPFWAAQFVNAIRTVATFEELVRFMSTHKNQIAATVKMLQQSKRSIDKLSIPASVEFNELSDVCASVHLLSALLRNPTHNIFDWKWIILATHSAVQGALVSAVSGTAGIGSLDKKSAKEMLAWFEESRTSPNAEYPRERLADFSSLLKRIQDEHYAASFGTVHLSETELSQMNKLHHLRCNFSHFIKMTWIIELDGIAGVILTALKLIEILTLNNDSVRYRFEDEQAEALQLDIATIRTLLK